MAQRLESLGGYRSIFEVGSPNAGRNPPALAHWRVPIGGQIHNVLSSVCFAGADYQGRFNKLAHHVVVEPHELTSAGPAWIMMPEQSVMVRKWTGQPRRLKPERIQIPKGDNPLRVCHAWAELYGDAGWAGMLAQAFVLNADRPAYIIYEPGMNMLPLINEAICLLPERMRWSVTFNTYFDVLPAGLDCTWRCCAAGSKAAEMANSYATSGIVIDLTSPSLEQPPSENAYVQMARTGQRVAVSTSDRERLNMIAAPLPIIPEPVSDSTSAGSTYELSELVPAEAAPTFPSPSAPTGRSFGQPGPNRKGLLHLAVRFLWPVLVLVVGGPLLWSVLGKNWAPPPTLTSADRLKKELEEERDLSKELTGQANRLEGELKKAREDLKTEKDRADAAELKLGGQKEHVTKLKKELQTQEKEIARLKQGKNGETVASVTQKPDKHTPAKSENGTTPVPTVRDPRLLEIYSIQFCELPPLLHVGITGSKINTGKYNEVLCNVAAGATIAQLQLPIKVPEPFSLSQGNSKIVYKHGLGRSKVRVLGHAHLDGGKLRWKREQLKASDSRIEGLPRLEKVLQYSTVRVYDKDEKELLVCQFVPKEDIRLTLDQDGVSKETNWPSTICNPVWGEPKMEPKWASERNPESTNLTLENPNGGVFVKLLIVGSESGQKTRVHAGWGSNCNPSSLRERLDDAVARERAYIGKVIGTIEKNYQELLPKKNGATIRGTLKRYKEDFSQASKDCENGLEQHKEKLGITKKEQEIRKLDRMKEARPDKDESSEEKEEREKRNSKLTEQIKTLKNGIKTIKTDRRYIRFVQYRDSLKSKVATWSPLVTKRQIEEKRVEDAKALRTIVIPIYAKQSGAVLGELTLKIGGQP